MIKNNSLVLFQGDSITDCQRRKEWEEPIRNREMGDGYPRLITADLRARRPQDSLDFLNRGISGNRIVDLYARWKADALNLRPDIISILIGVNDTWHDSKHSNGVEPDRFETVYRMLLEWTVKVLPGVRLVLMEPFVLPCGEVRPDWIPEMDERRGIIKRLSAEFDTLFVPLQDMFKEKAALTGPEYWLPDGVHPSAAGHRIIADRWLETVTAGAE